MKSHSYVNDQSHFNRSAWLVLVFALALVLLSAVQIVHRYTLRTYGWAVEPEPLIALRSKGGLWMVVEEAAAV